MLCEGADSLGLKEPYHGVVARLSVFFSDEAEVVCTGYVVAAFMMSP
jgi:hypothetical protein